MATWPSDKVQAVVDNVAGKETAGRITAAIQTIEGWKTDRLGLENRCATIEHTDGKAMQSISIDQTSVTISGVLQIRPDEARAFLARMGRLALPEDRPRIRAIPGREVSIDAPGAPASAIAEDVSEAQPVDAAGFLLGEGI